MSDAISDYARGYDDGYQAGVAHERERALASETEQQTAIADALIDARMEMHNEVLELIARERDRAIRSGANTTEIMTIRAILQRVRTMLVLAYPAREESET
jgi:hypothetical protein